MAERGSVGTNSNTSLKGMRERMVAAAHAIAEERRNQSGVSSFTSQSSNIKSSFKPVIDGSVLKNDVKQRLAKERREETRRQQDANKEMQLLEKARKAKLQYEKQMEEKQRKLREQKEKDEQRRISAEEKRKQKLEEEREKYKAVLYRTLERSNRVELRQKRWSWEGTPVARSESKSGDKRYVSTEKIEQGTSSFNKQMYMSPTGLQNSVAKRKVEKKRSSSLNRRDSKLHSSTDTEQVEGKPAVNSNPFRYVNVPMCTYNSDELKTTVIFSKSKVKMPLQTKLETAPQRRVETTPEASVEVPPRVNAEALPRASMEAPSKACMKTSSEASVEVPLKASLEEFPKARVEAPPEVNMDFSLKARIEVSPQASGYSSPEGSEDSSLVESVNVSPVVSTDESLELSTDTSPEVSVDISPEPSLEAPIEESLEALPEVTVEVNPEVTVEANPEVVNPKVTNPEVTVEAKPEVMNPEVTVEANPEVAVEASPEMSTEASSKVKVKDSLQKSEMDKQTSSPITKKPVSSHMPTNKWSPSLMSRWHPPFPVCTTQIRRNRPPSPSVVISKQSLPASLFQSVRPVQHTPVAQNTLGTVRKKRETVSKSANKCEASGQKHVIYEESGKKSTLETMNAEEATKILAERRRLIREQREKEEEERLRQEMESREIRDVAEEIVEGQAEELSKLKDEQQQKDTKQKKGCQDQEDQEGLLQKGNNKIKAQEEVDKRKKEHERIMLQNLHERLERKKRIEEIMKRTRKTDANASKAAETSSRKTYDENEADDEDESESDDDDSSFDDIFPSAIQNGRDSPAQLRAKKMSHRLMFLEATTGQVHKEMKTYFNGDLKSFKQKGMRERDPLTQMKSSRPSTKRPTRHTTKTRKVNRTSNTIRSSLSLNSNQEWICDKMKNIRSHVETSMSHIPPEGHKHNLKDSMTSCHSPQTSLDDETSSKAVSSHSDD
ncbi:MAP7 domain-containing protein 3 isoform X2 [Otolemur garnettii]|uniref:MAP7 domain-containing protein 3 isoform X2 n=1 Tax=Otolemur garnettii TaxID=30611 RepID=UPI00064431FE|nr:MAP7 domain-containing protein 3 isoform X2 [Otolemur garnettii]